MFPFMDVSNGRRWTLRPNLGRIPWWVLCAQATRAGHPRADYLALRRLHPHEGRRHRRRFAAPRIALRPSDRAAGDRGAEHAARRRPGPAARRGDARDADARRRCLHAGAAARRPVGEPGRPGHRLAAGARLRRAVRPAGRRHCRSMAAGSPPCTPRTARMPVEAVVLAVPPWVAADLLPGLVVPTAFEAILNIHFRVDAPMPGPGRLHRPDRRHGGVGVRQARPCLGHHQRRQPDGGPAGRDDRRRGLARCDARPWACKAAMPAWRVVKERRATFAATAEQERRRPGPRTDLRQPGAGRRLDRDRLARHHRRCHQVRPYRGARSFSPPEHEADAERDACHRGPCRDDRLDATRRRAPARRWRRRRHADGHWVFELEADATIPAEYVLLEHFLDRIEPALEAKIGVYLRAHPGRAWRLAAVPRRRVRPLGQREGVFRAEGDRRRSRRAAHGAGARGDPGGAAAPNGRNVFTRAQLALFGAGAVARGAGDAAGDHAPAAVVSVPSVEGVVLVAHGDRAAAGADGAAAAWRAIRAASRSRELFRTPPEQVRDWIRGPYRVAPGGASSRASTRCCASAAAAVPGAAAPARDRQGGRASSPSG